MKKALCIIIVLVGAAMFLSGCVYTDGQRQSVYQGGTTALGALAGQVIGGDTKSTLIGAGAGYIAGGLTKEFAYPRQETVVVQQQQQRHVAPPIYQGQQEVRVYTQPQRGPLWCPPKPICSGLRWAESNYERARLRQKCQVRMRDWRQ